MRIIGRLENESNARTFSDFLYVQGIQNQIEAENDGAWAVWIHGEDEIEPAKRLLQQFLSDPTNPAFHRAALEAKEKRIIEAEANEAAEKRYLKKHRVFREYGPYGNGRLTMILIGVSVLVFLLQELSYDNPSLREWVQSLYISEYKRGLRGLLPEVQSGQIWRVITPIFLHGNILHILFNMLWLKDLGSMIEARESSARLALLIFPIAAASNLGQYLVTGPAFGGMSGVVYGLLGYIWMRGKFDPASGYFLHPWIVIMMLAWFVICFTGILPVANVVHSIGLGLGVAWGYLSARRFN